MIDTTQLDPLFWTKCQQMITLMENEGYTIQLKSGLRSLKEQAQIWRKGRSTALINTKIDQLRHLECNFLADTLEKVGPQPGNQILTNSLPGYSWHNWGQALDVFVNNDASGSDALYSVLASKAIQLNLTPGFDFKTFKDPGHIQLHSFEIPSVYTLKQVNDHFATL